MKLSKHASKRASQRGIRVKDIEMAIKHGTKIYRTGVLFIFLCKKDLPEKLLCSGSQKLNGITLLVNPQQKEIVTLYKNSKAIKIIKRKMKRRK